MGVAPDWIIIGGGVPALMSAFYLRQRGAEVLMLDDNNPSASRAGPSILATLPPWQTPFEVNDMAELGAEAYPEILQTLGDDCGYRLTGMKVLPPHDSDVIDAWRERGGVAERDGEIWLFPKTAVLNPRRLMRALRRHVNRRIVKVKSLFVRGDRVRMVRLEEGKPLIAGRVLLSAGAWTTQLCPPPRLPIRPRRGQMLLFDRAGVEETQVLLQEDTHCYALRREDGRVYIGSTSEDVGFNASPTEEGRAWLREQAARMLPELEGKQERAYWAGLRPANPLPIIARHPQLHNLYINSGHFKYGVTMAPAAAQHLVHIAEGTLRGTNDFAYPRSSVSLL